MVKLPDKSSRGATKKSLKTAYGSTIFRRVLLKGHQVLTLWYIGGFAIFTFPDGIWSDSDVEWELEVEMCQWQWWCVPVIKCGLSALLSALIPPHPIKPSAPLCRTADQFKMLPVPSLFPPILLFLLLPILVTPSTPGCTKWDSCEEPEHYCYQVAPNKRLSEREMEYLPSPTL